MTPQTGRLSLAHKISSNSGLLTLAYGRPQALLTGGSLALRYSIYSISHVNRAAYPRAITRRGLWTAPIITEEKTMEGKA
jgi:hypothetical protein